jgi:sugar lactone lactonase YvrE
MERIAKVGGLLLEGPCWDAEHGRILFVDILRSEMLAYDTHSGELERIEVEETCSGWIPRRQGGCAIAARSGLRLADSDHDPGRPAVRIEADRPHNRSNDAKCDPAGRLWLGTMADDETADAGALYRIDPGLEATRVLTPITISNGLGWSSDGSRMYYVDSPTRRVDVFDYDLDTGETSNRRPLADTSHLMGVPDGLAVDAEGCMWVAFHDGGALHLFTHDGIHEATMPVPCAKPTSCAFVGDDLSLLAVTTAVAPDGTGGDLYIHEPEVGGLPVAPFAG